MLEVKAGHTSTPLRSRLELWPGPAKEHVDAPASEYEPGSVHGEHLSVPPNEAVEGGQTTHLCSVSSARIPGPQKVHLLIPTASATKPLVTSHSSQRSESPVLTEPSVQLLHDPLLAALNCPAGQDRQIAAPVLEYLPDGQSPQVCDPALAKVPAGQSVAHSCAPASLTVPAWHCWHSEARAELQVPASHGSQVSAPTPYM